MNYRQQIQENIFKSFKESDVIEKAAKANIGETRVWQGKTYMKRGEGDWVEVRKPKIHVRKPEPSKNDHSASNKPNIHVQRPVERKDDHAKVETSSEPKGSDSVEKEKPITSSKPVESSKVGQKTESKPVESKKTINDPKDLSNVLDLSSAKPLGNNTTLYNYPNSKQTLVVKRYPGGKEQMDNEMLADKIYEIFKHDTVDGFARNFNGEPVRTSSFRKNKPLSKLRGFEKKWAYESLRRGFVLDALLGNNIGKSENDIVVDELGHPVRVNNSGSMNYDRDGVKKEFGPKVTELKSLRDKNINPVTAKIYEGIKESDIKKQVKELVNKKRYIEEAFTKAGKTKELKTVLSRLGWLYDNYLNEMFDELDKAFNDLEVEKIYKGVKANIGEIRTWGGKRYRKEAEGKWKPVSEGKSKEGSEKR